MPNKEESKNYLNALVANEQYFSREREKLMSILKYISGLWHINNEEISMGFSILVDFNELMTATGLEKNELYLQLLQIKKYFPDIFTLAKSNNTGDKIFINIIKHIVEPEHLADQIIDELKFAEQPKK